MDSTLESISDRLSRLDLDGFLLKRGSPTCGISGVKVYAGVERKAQVVGATPASDAPPTQRLPGAGARGGGLAQRRHVASAVSASDFTSRRLKALREDPSVAALQAEYASHKLPYMAHHPALSERSVDRWRA